MIGSLFPAQAGTPAERASILGEARAFLAERDATYMRQAALAASTHPEQPVLLESVLAERLALEQAHANELRRLLGEKNSPRLHLATT